MQVRIDHNMDVAIPRLHTCHEAISCEMWLSGTQFLHVTV